jgi:hypothetical protein
MGNMVPMAMGAIVFLMARIRFGVDVSGAIAVVVVHIGINQLGFFENRKIERELREITSQKGELIGFVWKVPASPLDIHAEIGIMSLSERMVHVYTESHHYQIEEIVQVVRKPNVHSLVLLGGWVCLVTAQGEQFCFESRARRTMWQSRKYTNQLYEKIRKALSL